MHQLIVADIERVTGARLTASGTAVATQPLGRIVHRLWEVRPGDVFWPVDQHTVSREAEHPSLAAEAYELGASGVVSDSFDGQTPEGCWHAAIADSESALLRLAAWHRARFTGHVVAVAGSIGKTVNAQMVATALGGVAVTDSVSSLLELASALFNCARSAPAVIVELPSSSADEIEALVQLAQPGLAVITELDTPLSGKSIASDGVARVLASLTPTAYAVLHGDDQRLVRLARSAECRTVLVGRGVDCDLVAHDVRSTAGQLQLSIADHQYTLGVWGRHWLPAVLSAVAVARVLGIDPRRVASRLESFVPPPQRCDVVELAGTTIIDDSYGSHPAATRAAFDLLRDCHVPGRRIVLMGDMPAGQENTFEESLGAEVVTRSGADLLVACGPRGEQMARDARAAGMPAAQVRVAGDWAEALPEVLDLVMPGDAILIKASRSSAMEQLMAALETRSAWAGNAQLSEVACTD